MAVTSSVHFFNASLPGHYEKPYQLKFAGPDGFPTTNIATKDYDQKFVDIRGHEADYSVARHGFAIMRLEETMKHTDYGDDSRVQSIYLKQVADGLRAMLGASRVQIFEHVLRKRHADFPVATGEPYNFNQPTNVAHIDVTPPWSSRMASLVNEEGGNELPSRRFQFINVWKPLRGPIRDWPLAVCDATTQERADLQESDIVFNDRVVENYLVRWNPNQKWYYISDQMPDEAWVFLQSDTEERGLYGVAHSSFRHPCHTAADIPRESIEVRAIVFYEHGD